MTEAKAEVVKKGSLHRSAKKPHPFQMYFPLLRVFFKLCNTRLRFYCYDSEDRVRRRFQWRTICIEEFNQFYSFYCVFRGAVKKL